MQCKSPPVSVPEAVAGLQGHAAGPIDEPVPGGRAELAEGERRVVGVGHHFLVRQVAAQQRHFPLVVDLRQGHPQVPDGVGVLLDPGVQVLGRVVLGRELGIEGRSGTAGSRSAGARS